MAGADQSAKDSEPESSREKKLPSVGDRQKTTKISRSGDPETSLRGQAADEKRRKWKEKRRADPAAPPRGATRPPPRPSPKTFKAVSRPIRAHGCITADLKHISQKTLPFG